MADTINPNMQRQWTLTFNGKIDTSKEPTVTMVPEGFATVVSQPFDPTGNTQVHLVQHNGGIGDVAITIVTDGDPGAAERALSISHDFTMLDAQGATGVTDSVSAEEPISTGPPPAAARRRP